MRGAPTRAATEAETEKALRKTLNINTKEVFGKQNLRNYKANSQLLKRSKGIREIDSRYQGGPAIIVASGPSLDKNIDELQRAQGKIPIFACDASIPMLLAAGVEADYTMIVDVTTKQTRFFENVPKNTKTTLLALACTHPDVLAAWPGEVLFFNSFGSDKDEAIQMKYGADFGSIGIGGNVSTALFWLVGMFCEATTLILVGHDFSFDPHNYYAKNGIHELAAKKTRHATWDINGAAVQSEISLWGYRVYTHEWSRDLVAMGTGYRIINATEGGILGTTPVYGELLPYFEYRRLAETLDEIIGDGRPVDDARLAAPACAVEQGVNLSVMAQ